MNKLRPLVKGTLTDSELKAIIKASTIEHPSFDINNYLLVSKGWLTTWDGDYHVGYIIHHVKSNSMDAYFMEIEKTEEPTIHNDTYVFHNIKYHKWIPISAVPRNKRLERTRKSIPIKSIDALINRVINDNIRDEWGTFPADKTKSADLMNSINITFGNVDIWTEPIPADELECIEAERKVEEERLEKELIERFSKGELPPPEDDLWYRVLADVDSAGFGDKTLETKVLKILNDRGINAYIDGERDSFGWVTRGIFIDGKIMCIY